MDAHLGKRKRDRGGYTGTAIRNQPQRQNSRCGQGDQEQEALPTPVDTTYRILCSGVKIGTVIGRGGGIIKSLRKETNARIKVLESVPGAEERVILVWSTQRDDERKKHRDGAKDHSDGGTGEDGDTIWSKKSKGGFLCAAQEALFKVYAKIVEDDERSGSHDQTRDNRNSEAMVRLLVPNNQIGCLLGKGGRVIEKMRNETGANIRISSKDTLPGCALPTDELVQISGDLTVVKRALYEVSARIYESPLRDRPQGQASSLPPPVLPPRGPAFPTVNPLYGMGNVGGGGPPMSGFGIDSGPPWSMGSHSVPRPYPPHGLNPLERHDLGKEEDFSIRMLCPNERIGMVIGKGGNAIRHLRDITNARIKVEDAVPDSDERVISISAAERLHDHSPVIEACLKLLIKINDGGDRDDEGLLTSRLLVPTRQIGCLLGKRGSVITEMRKKTTASLKVLQKVDLPKCGEDSDELVQIIGDENVARKALLEVLSRLRCNVFGMELDEFLESGGAVGPPFTGMGMNEGFGGPPFAGLGVNEGFGGPPFARSGMNEGFGGPPHFPGLAMNEGFGGPPPTLGTRHDVGFSAALPSNVGIRHDMGYRGSMHSFNGYGSQGGQYESNIALPPVSPLQVSASGYGGYSDLDTNTYSSRLFGEGGSFGDVSTRSKIFEMIIPGASASSVLGKSGSNLASIRQISGAKLSVLDPHPISGDRIVEIRGTPEQTQAAQSLLQAFIYSGQSSSGSGLHGLH